MSGRLPQELVDHIIDDVALSNDVVKLQYVSLICKAWLPRSSQHLFNKTCITISSLARLEELAALLKTSSRLERYVRHVAVLLGSEDGVSIHLTISLISSIIARLPHLEEVSVACMRVFDDKALFISPASVPLHPVAANALPHLTLVCADASLTHALLSLFPSVHTLDVISWSDVQLAPAQPAAHNVTELAILRPLDTATLADLAALIHPPCLSRLVIDYRAGAPRNASPAALDPLFRALGAHLTAFEFHHSYAGTAPGPSDIPALASCTRLRTATLSAPVQLPARRAGHTQWADVLGVLPQLPRTLARLTLAVHVVASAPSAAPAADVRGAVCALGWLRVRDALGHCGGGVRVEVVLRLEMVFARVEEMTGEAWKGEVRESVRRGMAPRECEVTFQYDEL